MGVRLKVSLKPFQRLVGAAAIGGRLRRGETPFTAFSFCQAFSFVPFASKEKAENDLDERYGCRPETALTKPSPLGKANYAKLKFITSLTLFLCRALAHNVAGLDLEGYPNVEHHRGMGR